MRQLILCRREHRPRLTLTTLILCALSITACSGGDDADDDEISTQPIATQVPAGTVLRIGDPQTQKVLEITGELERIPYRIEWANFSGGPRSIEAFRGGSLDTSSIGDIPPIQANATGIPARIIAVRLQSKPIYRLASAPGVALDSLEDLRGKRIAYSPGQAQGAIVLRSLRKAGLSPQDVTLIELQSTDDVYPSALAAKQVDVAPLATTNLTRYLRDYARDGAQSLVPGVNDGIAFLYAPNRVLNDPARASALRDYVVRWIRAGGWIERNPEQWVEHYFVADQRITAQQGRQLIEERGEFSFPTRWDEIIDLQQETIDLLAEAGSQQWIEAESLFDRRFESLAGEALSEKSQ